MATTTDDQSLAFGTPRARWVLAATVLGSGIAFIDATVVNVALPQIGADLGSDLSGLQWTINAYTLTLASLILLGGSLGDRYGRRRIFLVGVVWFALASLLCGIAPNIETLVLARALQGVGGALLTPGSLAILQSSFRAGDRARAIGAWSGLAGIGGAAGPFLGGWLIQSASWRWIFLINLPIAAVVLVISLRHVPESRDPGAAHSMDLTGAALGAVGLGALTYGLIAWPEQGLSDPATMAALVIGVLGLASFVAREHFAREPMLPLAIFRSRVFSATNAVTFAVYGALGGVFFLLVLQLQVVSGFSPIAVGRGATAHHADHAGAVVADGGARRADRSPHPDDVRAVGVRGRERADDPHRCGCVVCRGRAAARHHLRARPLAHRRAADHDRAGGRPRGSRRTRERCQQRRCPRRQPARGRGPAADRGAQRCGLCRPGAPPAGLREGDAGGRRAARFRRPAGGAHHQQTAAGHAGGPGTGTRAAAQPLRRRRAAHPQLPAPGPARVRHHGGASTSESR